MLWPIVSLLITLAFCAAVVLGLYYLVKIAVRNGVREALNERDRQAYTGKAEEPSQSQYQQ